MLDFSKMSPFTKVYWKVKLWLMDHKFSLIETHWDLLKPSYYYTHTPEECEQERLRIRAELLAILDERTS